MDAYLASEQSYKNGYKNDYEDAQTIANEISWRAVMRIVHKLRRKRGAE